MSRLFTFGCSFTNYRWSTWADCLAPEFDEFYNWGQSGAGNHFIFNSVMEADQRHNFSTGDTVIVCWTNVIREDRYITKWQTLGNMMHTPIYVKEYITNTITERGCLIRDLAFIKATKTLLSYKKDVDWKFLSMIPITRNDLWDDHPMTGISDIIELYQDVLLCIGPSYREILRPLGWGDDPDPHPSPVEHLKYLDSVLPGWVTKQETRAKMLEETALLEQNKYKLENHRPRRSGLSTVQRL